MESLVILAINPGSTSTKIALFENDREIWNETQRYDVDVLQHYPGIPAQEPFRFEEIMKSTRLNSSHP